MMIRAMISRWREQLSRGRPGQTIVFFALGSLVILGGLGLALDAGYDYMLRRVMQNAVDAAALRGAFGVYKNETSTMIASETQSIAIKNGLRDPAVAANNTTFTCTYVDNTQTERGSCAAGFPAGVTISGVKATATEQHQTFVMRVLGIATSGTGATATAHVMSPAASVDAPIIVCGYKTGLAAGQIDDDLDEGLDSRGKPNPPDNRFSILTNVNASGVATLDPNTGTATLNPALLSPDKTAPVTPAKWFLIHSPNNNKQFQDGCDTQAPGGSQRFQGVHINKSPITGPPGYTDADHGNHGRNVASDVIAASLTPCSDAIVTTTGCVLVLPIGDNASIPASANCPAARNDDCIHVVRWVAFLVKRVGSGKSGDHIGQVLPDGVYLVDGQLNWKPGSGPATVKLSR